MFEEQLAYCKRIIKAQDDVSLFFNYLLTEFIYDSEYFDNYCSEWVLIDEFLNIRQFILEEIAFRFCSLFNNDKNERL